MAEGRGKAQADTLRKMRSETEARRLNARRHRRARRGGAARTRATSSSVKPGDVIPSDGEIIEGIASVDESAITGESAPVIRESGGDRSAVTGGTKVLSDRIVVRITAERGQTFIDRMITLVEGANRQKTPNEIALTILLSVLTIIFIPVVVTLVPFANFGARPSRSWCSWRCSSALFPRPLAHCSRRSASRAWTARPAQRARDEWSRR